MNTIETKLNAELKYDATFRRISCGDGAVIECMGTDTETAEAHLKNIIRLRDEHAASIAVLQRIIVPFLGLRAETFDAYVADWLTKARAIVKANGGVT